MSDVNVMSQKGLMDEFDDLLVRMAVSSYAEQIGREYLAESERLNKEFGAIPLEAQATLRKALRRSSFSIHGKAARRTAKRLLNAAAVVVLVIVVLFSITMVTVEAARNKVFSVIYEWSQTGRASVGFQNGEDGPFDLTGETPMPLPQQPHASDAVWQQSFNWVPTELLPEGYEEVSRHVTIPCASEVISYRTPAGDQLSFQVLAIQDRVSLDYESSVVEKVMIHDCEGILLKENNGYITVYWSNGKVSYVIEGTESPEVMLELAHHVKSDP